MRNLLIILGLFFLVGCSVNKTFSATGGSKADGTVRLSYWYGAFETPNASLDETAHQTAKDRCNNWGYSDAKSFDEVTRSCVSWNAYGCIQYQVSVDYQCID